MDWPTHAPGPPFPLGVSRRTIDARPCWCFAIESAHASRLTLLLYSRANPRTPILTRELDARRDRRGTAFLCAIPIAEARDAAFYAFRADGPRVFPNRFDPDKVLHDPRAHALHFPSAFRRDAAIARGPNDAEAPLGVLPRDADPVDPRDIKPWRPPRNLVLYELHAKGFTFDARSGVPSARRGTFAGLIDKIPYLADLGVTCVELMPVFQFDPQEANYWGYMPLSFFAVHQAYASHAARERSGDWGAKDEFRAMVRAMHDAGIGVVLDVVHNHSGEGDTRYPTYSLRGLDNASYYIPGPSPEAPYRDFSGCGNSLNASSDIARRLVIDSLRYWLDEMRADGFRHDLAAALMRAHDGSIPSVPPMAAAMTAWEGFHRAIQIVEPWDAAGAHLAGQAFPIPGVMQWNGAYRDDLRRFLRGDTGMVGAMARRLYGSDDLFPDAPPGTNRPAQSINYITSHDGATLYDLLSYTQKHNHANGHDNRDGSHEYAMNCGHEGDEGVPQHILALRQRQAKNACALLMLSAGTPMLRAGDEFLQTQGGNTNPYNQDNATSWLDWSRAEAFAGVRRFFKLMIAFRARHPSLTRSTFWRDDVRWFGEAGAPDWSHESRRLAFFLDGASERDDDLYVMINMGDDERRFTPQVQGPWRLAVDTALATPDDIAEDARAAPAPAERHLAPKSVVVLVKPRGA